MDQWAYCMISHVLALYGWGVAGVLRQIWNLVSLCALGPMLAHMCIVEICRVCLCKSGMGVVVDPEEAFWQSPEMLSNHHTQTVWVNGVVCEQKTCCHEGHNLWGSVVFVLCIPSTLTGQVGVVVILVGFLPKVLCAVKVINCVSDVQ